MPFTLSHAVLAPCISKVTGYWLPTAALAIGCMIPDLYRLFVKNGHSDPYLAHYWSSLLYPDMFLGLVFSFFWYVLYRPVIYKFIGIEHHISIRNFKALIQFIINICISLIIGTCTHIIWDGLTHVDFRTIFFKEILEKDISIFGNFYELHMILQIVTSIMALPILIWMLWQYYQKYRIESKVNKSVFFSGWGLVLLSIFTGFTSIWYYLQSLPTNYWKSNIYNTVGISFNQFSQSTLFVFTLGCILFQFFFVIKNSVKY